MQQLNIYMGGTWETESGDLRYLVCHRNSYYLRLCIKSSNRPPFGQLSPSSHLCGDPQKIILTDKAVFQSVESDEPV